MKKINESYVHEKTGINFNVDYTGEIKRMSVTNKNSRREFVFTQSKTETLAEVGKALVEISEFVEKL